MYIGVNIALSDLFSQDYENELQGLIGRRNTAAEKRALELEAQIAELVRMDCAVNTRSNGGCRKRKQNLRSQRRR